MSIPVRIRFYDLPSSSAFPEEGQTPAESACIDSHDPCEPGFYSPASRLTEGPTFEEILHAAYRAQRKRARRKRIATDILLGALAALAYVALIQIIFGAWR